MIALISMGLCVSCATEVNEIDGFRLARMTEQQCEEVGLMLLGLRFAIVHAVANGTRG